MNDLRTVGGMGGSAGGVITTVIGTVESTAGVIMIGAATEVERRARVSDAPRVAQVTRRASSPMCSGSMPAFQVQPAHLILGMDCAGVLANCVMASSIPDPSSAPGLGDPITARLYASGDCAFTLGVSQESSSDADRIRTFGVEMHFRRTVVLRS